QVGHIHTRDEQDESNRAEEYQQRRAHVVRDRVAVGRRDEAYDPPVAFTHPSIELGDKWFGKASQVAAGLRVRDARPQPADHTEILAAADGLAHLPDGSPQVGGRNALKAGRHHADDGVRNTIQQNTLTHGVGVGVKVRLPKSIVQDRDARAARAVFLGTEVAAQERLNRIDVKVVRRNAQGRQALGSSCSCQVEAHASRGGKILERLAVLPPEIKSKRGKAREALNLTAERARDLNHALGSGIRQRAEKHAIHNREHRRVRPDAEGERQHGHGGKGGTSSKHPQAIANVAQQSFHVRHLRSGVRLSGARPSWPHLYFAGETPALQPQLAAPAWLPAAAASLSSTTRPSNRLTWRPA